MSEDLTVEPPGVDTRPHGTRLISQHDSQDPYAVRATGEGQDRPGAFREDGERAERHNRDRAQALDHERGEELSKRDDARGNADELSRSGDVEAAEVEHKEAELHEARAAVFGTEADALRHEAANSYSTTVAGPPGPKGADAAQQQSATKVNQVKQQAPARRVR